MEEIVEGDLEAAMGGAGEESESLRQKRPDAWGINWGARTTHLMEYTRPNDRAAEALQTMTHKNRAIQTTL